MEFSEACTAWVNEYPEFKMRDVHGCLNTWIIIWSASIWILTSLFKYLYSVCSSLRGRGVQSCVWWYFDTECSVVVCWCISNNIQYNSIKIFTTVNIPGTQGVLTKLNGILDVKLHMQQLWAGLYLCWSTFALQLKSNVHNKQGQGGYG